MTAPKTGAVLDALEAAGGAGCARFVGGCVRNTLMGKQADDVDIATLLRPERVIAALEGAGLRAVPTGVEHGTVTAISGYTPYEITTLRRDVETDGRRAVVAFSDDWAEDAARRDFRLNALYADREGRVFDPVGGGVEDALAGRIVFVGDAETRIREDYLRILRFFRFFAWYGRAEPDQAGVSACKALKDGLAGLSAERISKELLKLFAAREPRPAVRLMDETGVLQVVLPWPLDLPRFEAMVGLQSDPILRLSALLPDDVTVVRAAAEGLRLSNMQRDRLCAAVPDQVVVTPEMDEAEARRAIYRIGREAFADRLMRAAAAGQGDPSRLAAMNAQWTAPRFPLGGAHAAAAGVPRGPAVGRLLRAVEDWWVEADFPAEGVEAELTTRAKALKPNSAS
jgi:poly(A) polymerase